MNVTLTSPVTTERHAVITLQDKRIDFEISDGGGYGSEPYGGATKADGHFTIMSAWRAVERVLVQRDVETTEVIDAREEVSNG